ncbi:MAG: glycosyltransferase [Saprospiraceae bacterium]
MKKMTQDDDRPLLIRITTVPLSLKVLLTGQMHYMQEHGFRVLMVSADGPEREPLIRQEACPHMVIPMTRAITPFRDLQCLWQLIKLFHTARPAIVHSHTPKAGLLSMWAGWITRVPVRIHTVSGLHFLTSHGWRRAMYQMLERWTNLAANRVLVVSKSMSSELKERKLCEPRKIEMIAHGSSNGVDLERYSPERISQYQVERLKADIGYVPERTYLLAISRIVVDKGIDDLVQGFLKLWQEDRQLHLILLGDVEQTRTAETVSRDLLSMIQRHPAMTHIPWSEDVPLFLDLADLLVHPSHREGFSNVLLQAGAMGCPIVCSDIPGNTDLVEQDVTGMTFEPGNVDELVSSLRSALGDMRNMHQMASRLQASVRHEYERKMIHRELWTFYQERLSNYNREP